MKSHKLAKFLLENEDVDVALSLDVSTGEHDSDNRLLASPLCDVIMNGDEVVMVFCDPEPNFDEKDDQQEEKIQLSPIPPQGEIKKEGDPPKDPNEQKRNYIIGKKSQFEQLQLDDEKFDPKPPKHFIGKKYKELTDKLPFEVPPFKHRPSFITYTWWSWHPNYPYWSKSCWSATSVEEAMKLLERDYICLDIYHNKLIKEDGMTLEEVADVPCKELDIWWEIKRIKDEKAQ
jgi:hypothetical protein